MTSLLQFKVGCGVRFSFLYLGVALIATVIRITTGTRTISGRPTIDSHIEVVRSMNKSSGTVSMCPETEVKLGGDP